MIKNKTNQIIKLLAIFSIAFFALFVFNINNVQASTKTWTGASSNLWSDGGNWGGTAPVTGDDLLFPGTASNLSNTNDLTENTIINSITFAASGYTLSGNKLILGAGLAGITDSASSGGNTIALDIRLDATRDIVVSNSGETLTISGRIAGVGGITKEGLGKLVLSGANTYGGTTKINVGVINAQNDRALGTILAGTEVVGNAALELQGGINISYEALALRGHGVNSGGALRNISNDNSYSGLITMIAGGARITSDSGTLTLKGGMAGAFPLVIDGAGNVTYSTTPIGIGAGTVTKNGAGTLTYNFPNTYTGLTTINAGTLLYGVDNALLSGAITVTGGTLDIATYSDMVGTVTLGTLDLASGTITGTTGMLSSGTWTVYNGTISAIIAGDAGAMTKSTPGTVTLTRPNQYTGATTISAGILEIQDSLSLGTIDGITTVSAGATLQIDGNSLSIPEYITFSSTGHLYTGAIRNTTGDNTITGLLTMGADAMIKSDASTTLTIDSKGISASTRGLTIGGDGNTVFTSTAPIYGTSAALTKQGGGTLTMEAFNNFTGATNINYGNVVLSGAGAMPLSTAMTISPGGTLTLDNTNSTNVVDRIADSLALTMNGGSFNFIGSDYIDTDESAGVLTSGIATQSGNNTITITPGSGGSTTMQFASLTRTAGSSILFRGNSFGSTPGANVSTLLFKTAPTLTGSAGAANSTTISIIAGAFGDDSTSGTGTDMVTYGVGNSNGLRLLNGAGFSGEYAFTLATNANVKLTSSTTAATASINSLLLSGSANITDAGTSQTITLTSGNILNLVSSNTIAGANTTIAGGAVELQVLNPVNLTISSNITGSTGLTKSGAGTLEFSSAKNYTGLTSVNQGTLLYSINNAISSGNVTVNGGTLDIATFTDTVGAVILQTGTITGSTGVLTSSASYNFREGTVSAIIAGSVAVTRIVTNTAPDSVVLLTRENTYTGVTTITSGILKIGTAGNGTNTPLGTTGTGTTIASGGALDLNGFTFSTAEAITSLAGTGFGPSGSSNMGAVMNSSGTTASYSGTMTLTAASRINADAGAFILSSNISGNFALTFGGFSNMTYSGVRSGTSTIVKDGIGVLTLSGDSSYSGATTISVGTVKLGANGGGTNTPLGTTAGATTVALGARLDLNGYTLGIAEPLTLNGVGYGLGDFASGSLINSSGSSVTYSGLLTIGSTGALIKVDSGSINMSNTGNTPGTGFTLILGGTGMGTLAASLTTGTSGAVTKIDTGTWTLSGAGGTFTGAVTVYRGTLKLGAAGNGTNTPFGTSAGGIIVLSGAVLDLNGFTLGLAEAITLNGRGVDDGGALVGGAVTWPGTIAQATDSRITSSSGTLTITGAVTGAFALYVGGAGNTTFSAATGTAGLSLTKQGAGTLTVTGTNTHTGQTRVDAGTLAYAGTTTLAATPLLMLGGTFNNGANADTIGAVTLISGTITNSAALTGTAYTMESGTVSGILAGAVAFTKNTNNTVTLTGVNTISSTMTINAGTVAISGSGSAVSVTGITVNLGGTLTLDNSSTAVASRIGDAVVVTMNGGNLNFAGNASGTASETMGQLALASGHNTVTVTPGAGGSTTLTFASNPGFNRTAGATVLFRGTSFGSTPAANVSTLMFTTTPTLTGAAGSANSTTVSVIKGAFGDSSLSGTGSDMVTYNVGNSNGLRLLNGAGFSGEYSATLTTNTNVKLTAGVAASTVSINSLILNGYGVTNASATITLASASLSGNILINSATSIAGANTTLGITTNELDILATANGTVSAVIGTAAAGSLAFSGSGNVTFSAANLYTGTTYVNGATMTYGTNNVLSSGGMTIVGGTVNLNGNSDTVGSISINAGTIATGAGTLTGNGTFSTVANNNVASFITGNLGLGANATFTINDGLMDNDVVASAVISGGFTFAKAGAGAFMLSGNNTYSGATTISAGILRLGAAGGGTNTPLGTTAGGTTVSGATAALDLNGYTLGTTEGLTLSTASLATGALQNTSSANVSYNGQIILTSGSGTIISNYGDINITATGNITGSSFGLTIGGAGNGTLASNLNTASGTLTKNGVGVWTISGASSTFTGATTVSAGTLKLGATGNGSNTPLGTSAGGVSITSGAILDLNGYTLGTAESVTINGTGIASVGAFINTSNNSVTYSGPTVLGAASRIANYGTSMFILSGNMSGNFARTFVTVGDITQSSASVWSGSGTLVKEGSGTLILAGQNSMTGAMTISTGVLQLGASGGATNTPLGTNAGLVTVSAGAVLDFSTYSLGGASTYETLNISGTGIKNTGVLKFSASGNNNFGVMTVAANARVINSGSGIVTFGGTITAGTGISFAVGGSGPVNITGVYGATATTATITKWNSGILTISAASITTGLVRINGGTLKYGIADALATPAVTVAGGTWDLNGYSEGGTTLIGAVTLIDGSIVNTGGAATITSSATYTVENGTISAVLAGAAIAMAKNTGGTVTLSAANTFAGTTTINAGTLAWGINNALSSGALTVTGGTADIATFTDTVGAVTLTSGSIIGSSGVLTGTSYPFASGTISAILGGAIAVAKTTAGTVAMTGVNTYTGTTTITAGVLRANSTSALGDGSGTNTLIFNGGTLQAGGDISSPSGRTVTLTSAGTFDTNNYTITIAGTMGSASGLVKYGTGTLSTTGVVTLGSTMTINNGIYDQGNNLTSGAVTVASSGVWQNIGTGSVTLSGAVVNSGIIHLDSNNLGCAAGANSILIRSSVNNTTRAWSGAGTFSMYNLDVDDMTGSIVTAYYSTFSGDTTWTVGSSCGISISGTANGNNGATVKVAVNGSLNGSTGSIANGTWTITPVVAANNDIVTVWVDNVADNFEATAVTKYLGSGNITGMVLNTNVLSIGSNQDSSVSVTNLGLYDNDQDEDILHTSNSGVLNTDPGSVYTSDTISVLASDTLTAVGTVTHISDESIVTEKIINAGTITASEIPEIILKGTSGTLFTQYPGGAFDAGNSTVVLNGNGSATIATGSPQFYNLLINGTGTKSLAEDLNVTNNLIITAGTIDTTSSNHYTINTGGMHTLGTASGTFGYNTIGGSNTTTGNIFMTRFTANGTSIVNKITAYLAAVSGTVNMHAAIYSTTPPDSLNPEYTPNKLIGKSPISVSLNTTPQWLDIPISDTVVVSGLEYYLAIWGDGGITYYYDSDTEYLLQTNSGGSYPVWPEPIDITYSGISQNKASTYATYASTAGTTTANSSNINLSGTDNVFTKTGTFNAGTSTIKIINNSSDVKYFNGGGGSYNKLFIDPDYNFGTFNPLSQASRNWTGIAVNTGNNNVYATVDGGDIYKQTNETGTFAALSQTSRAWRGIAINSSTNDVYAVVYNGDIYKQTSGSGSFGALSQTTRNWNSVAIDTSNANVYATVYGGDIYKQTGGSGSFVALGQTSRNWSGIAVDQYNQDVYATVYGGDIYKQTGGSGSFVALGQTSRNWSGIAMNTTASYADNELYASVSGSGQLYKKTYNSNAFNSMNQTIRDYLGIAFNRTTGSAYAIVNGGDIYKQSTVENGGYVINGSNTFATFENSASYPYTIQFAAGSTQTVTNFNVNGGGLDKLVTLKSTVDNSVWTVSKSSGTVNSNYLAIRDSDATGGATFYALNSSNIVNNTGWNFFARVFGGGGGGVESSAAPDPDVGGGGQGGGGGGAESGGNPDNQNGGGGQGGGGDIGFLLWKFFIPSYVSRVFALASVFNIFL